MPKNQDHVISQPVQSSNDDNQPSFSKNKSSSTPPNAGGEKEKRIKTKQELLEHIILRHAMYKPSSRISADATEKEKQADRQRWLNKITTRWRKIFFHWPRDPKGKYITPNNSLPGKMAPNGVQIWGATLFNFYSVRRIPELSSLVTLSSGSKLAAWMKANREYCAESMLDLAEHEADPELIIPCNITRLIQDGDVFVSKKSWIRDDQDKDSEGSIGKGKIKGREDWQVPQPWPPSSPFDSRAYPKPWPIEPFTKDVIGGTRYPKLQTYIIQSHLPKILKVHDPWNLLRAVRVRDYHLDGEQEGEIHEWEEEKKKKWSEKIDVVHTYRLKTSSENTARRTQDDESFKADEAKRKAVYDKFVADPHSRNETPSGNILCEDPVDGSQPGPAKPPIFIVFPFQSPIPPAPEAHLYLSPNESIGEGNHSFIYSAEFELTRSTIMEDEICHECIMEGAVRILKEQDGPNGECRDPKWDEKVGRYVVKEVGRPAQMMSFDVPGDVPGQDEYLLEPSTLCCTLEYDGPYRLIHSKIGYQCLERGPFCEHIAKDSRHSIHPLTAKVKVAAKLSIENDNHLSKEAEIYQAFPRHFFEHWSGFNVIKPLKEPVPVGPLVPQFYGYYVPDEDPEKPDTDESKSRSSMLHQYRSPILLIEDCGKSLDPQKLTLDDQSEAASLIFRLHEAGWIHGSVAKRNILIQPGPLSDFPLMRYANTHKRGGHGVEWSFRLIDFGRSYDIRGRPGHEQNNLMMAEANTIEQWIFHNEDLH